MKFSNKKNNSVKKAFTMAEAILVMTILGIIATIMITTLKPSQFKDKGLRILYKKILAEIDTATTEILIKNSASGKMDNSNSSTQTPPFYLKDGALLFLGAGEKYQLDINSNTQIDVEGCTMQSNLLGLIALDINGEEKPNALYKDQFLLPIEKMVLNMKLCVRKKKKKLKRKKIYHNII